MLADLLTLAVTLSIVLDSMGVDVIEMLSTALEAL